MVAIVLESIVSVDNPGTETTKLKIGDVEITLNNTNLQIQDVRDALSAADIAIDGSTKSADVTDLTKLTTFFKGLFSKKINEDQAKELIQGILALDDVKAEHLTEIFDKGSLGKSEVKKALNTVLQGSDTTTPQEIKLIEGIFTHSNFITSLINSDKELAQNILKKHIPNNITSKEFKSLLDKGVKDKADFNIIKDDLLTNIKKNKQQIYLIEALGTFVSTKKDNSELKQEIISTLVELSSEPLPATKEAAIQSLKRIHYPTSDSENAKNGCYFIEQLLQVDDTVIKQVAKKALLQNIPATNSIAKKLSLQDPEKLDAAYIDKLTKYGKFSSNDDSFSFDFADGKHRDMILRAPSDLKDMLDKVQSIEEFKIDGNTNELLKKLFIDKKGNKDNDVAWIPSGYIERFLATYNNNDNKASLEDILKSWEDNPDKENPKTEEFYKALIKADFLVKLENSQKPGSKYMPSFLGSWGYSGSVFDSGSYSTDTKNNNRNFLQNVMKLDKLTFLGEDDPKKPHPFIKIVDEYSRCSSEASKALYRKAVYATLSDLKVLKSDKTLKKGWDRNIKSAEIDAEKSLPCSKDDFYHLVHLNIANKRKGTSKNDLAQILKNTDDIYKKDEIQQYVAKHKSEMIDREKNNKDILCVKEPKQSISCFAGGVGGAIRYVVNATVSPFRKVANGASYYSDLPCKTISKAYASRFGARETDSAIFKK